MDGNNCVSEVSGGLTFRIAARVTGGATPKCKCGIEKCAIPDCHLVGD